jgi:hypothetical protein
MTFRRGGAGALIVAILLILGLNHSPSLAVTVDDDETVWILGKKYKQESGLCFGKSDTRGKTYLELRNPQGDWKRVATAKNYRKSKSCQSDFKDLPYTAWYEFTVSESGTFVGDAGENYRLQAREISSDGEKFPFQKTVYPTEQAHAEALLLSLVGEALVGSPSGTPSAPQSSAPRPTLSKLGGCRLDGVPLQGSVYISRFESMADFSVYQSQFESMADLKVYETRFESMASRCGVWYFTPYESMADFSIFFTRFESMADFSIYFTRYESMAGVR